MFLLTLPYCPKLLVPTLKLYCHIQNSVAGVDSGFQVREGALKKIVPSRGRHEFFWGILCEKSRFYAKKSYFFQFQGGGGAHRVSPPPGSAPALFIRSLSCLIQVKKVLPTNLPYFFKNANSNTDIFVFGFITFLTTIHKHFFCIIILFFIVYYKEVKI